MLRPRKKMRVVHIIKAKQIGGAERHLLILLPALRKRGVDAHLLMIVEADNMMTNMMDEAHTLDIPVQRVVIYGNTDPLIISRMRKILRDLKPDVVHTHLIHADIFGVIAARLAGIKTIITGRHNDDDFRHKRVVFWLNRLIWWLVQGGIAISDAIEQFMLIVEKAPPEKLRVVTYGIPHISPQPDDLNAAKKSLRAAHNLPEDALLIGMACRLVEQKGIIYALRAFQKVADDFPHLHFILAGEGELQHYLETETEKLNLADRVHFVGWVED
ncbi:MAG: glycosyltransferase, partial [Aggregatilineales bacterium]